MEVLPIDTLERVTWLGHLPIYANEPAGIGKRSLCEFGRARSHLLTRSSRRPHLSLRALKSCRAFGVFPGVFGHLEQPGQQIFLSVVHQFRLMVRTNT